MSKKYSTDGFLLELSKLKLTEMTDGKKIELTKKAKGNTTSLELMRITDIETQVIELSIHTIFVERVACSQYLGENFT